MELLLLLQLFLLVNFYKFDPMLGEHDELCIDALLVCADPQDSRLRTVENSFLLGPLLICSRYTLLFFGSKNDHLCFMNVWDINYLLILGQINTFGNLCILILLWANINRKNGSRGMHNNMFSPSFALLIDIVECN